MGNSEQIIHTVTLIDLNEWKQVGIHRQTCKIVQNQQTNVLAQLQSIPFNPKNNLQKQIEIYQYRKSQTMALVSCLGVTYQKINTSSLCGSSHILKVLTQRIPVRLNQLPQLSFSQSLYILSESLRGYKDCYSKLGAFYVDDEMIGINIEGETKVWVNQNFAQNHPTIEKPLLQTSGSQIEQSIEENLQKSKEQTEMVNNIIKVVEKKCQNGHFPAAFRQKIYHSPLTFDQAFKEIQNFVKTKGIFVPDRIVSHVSALKRSPFPTLMTENLDQRVSFVSPTSEVSRRLFSQTQQTPQRLSSPTNYPPTRQSEQRSHSPFRVLFQRQHETTQLQRSPNHIPQVRSIPIASKVTFRFLSPDNINQTFKQRNNYQINRQNQ